MPTSRALQAWFREPPARSWAGEGTWRLAGENMTRRTDCARRGNGLWECVADQSVLLLIVVVVVVVVLCCAAKREISEMESPKS